MHTKDNKMKYFMIYNHRSERFSVTSDLRSFVNDVNSYTWDVIVSDLIKTQKFLSMSDAAELLDFESPFDSDDGYMIAFSIVSLLSDYEISYSVAFNDECGSWGLEVECYELVFLSTGLGAATVDKETGESVLTKELESVCEQVDRLILELNSDKKTTQKQEGE